MNSPSTYLPVPELLEEHPDITVLESEYKRLLGYPAEREFEGRVQELAEWSRQWYAENGKPWMYIRDAGGVDLIHGTMRLDGAAFSPGKFRDRLIQAQAHDAVLVAVSAGKACEETARTLWNEGKADEYFFLEVYASAVVEYLVAKASFHLCAWSDSHGFAVLPHYSPGYPGWSIKEQASLLDLITKNGSIQLPEDVRALESGMLQPKKSLLAVSGITRHSNIVRRLTEMIPCETCSLFSCQYRRAPYRRFLPQTEDIRQFRSRKVTAQ